MTITAPVDHERERPGGLCLLLGKVSCCISMRKASTNSKNAEEETWNCSFCVISLVFESPIFRNHVVLPSVVYSSIHECIVVFAVHTPHVCVLYMYTVPARIRAHLVQSGAIVNLHGICKSFHPSRRLQYITRHNSNRTLPTARHE